MRKRGKNKMTQKSKALIIALVVFIGLYSITIKSMTVHYEKYYYRYSTETCLVVVEENNQVSITRPNGHKYLLETALFKNSEKFYILKVCDNGTPKNYEDDFFVFGK